MAVRALCLLGASWGVLTIVAGVALAAIPLIWALHHLVKAGASTWGGALSDRTTSRFGRRVPWLIGCGALTVGTLMLLATANSLALLFVGYGLSIPEYKYDDFAGLERFSFDVAEAEPRLFELIDGNPYQTRSQMDHESLTELADSIKAAGVLVHEHSDGFILPLIDDIIAMGGDIINLQDLVNGLPVLRAIAFKQSLVAAS